MDGCMVVCMVVFYCLMLAVFLRIQVITSAGQMGSVMRLKQFLEVSADRGSLGSGFSGSGATEADLWQWAHTSGTEECWNCCIMLDVASELFG